MVFYISASANNAGALLGCSYYCVDANGNYLSEVGSAGPNQTLTTTQTTYAFHFTVPNDPNIKSIEPILITIESVQSHRHHLRGQPEIAKPLESFRRRRGRINRSPPLPGFPVPANVRNLRRSPLNKGESE